MPEVDDSLNPQRIGILGAGIMGSDLALELASKGYEVTLKDLTDIVLHKAEQKIKDGYKFMKMMRKGSHSLSTETLLSRIRFVTDYQGFDEVEMVIENVPEIYDEKRRVYNEVVEVCEEDVVYGVNTSCISITKIAALMPRPENVIGMHFMNPVPNSELVEVIKGVHTSEQTLNITKSFIMSLEKTCVVVNDFPGFVTNRVLMLSINECVWLVQDKVAEARNIDKIFKLGFGHKMGPLATADLIGLDSVLNSLVVLYESYNDPKFRPCPLLRRMVDAGLLGRKTGKGFFEYAAHDAR